MGTNSSPYPLVPTNAKKNPGFQRQAQRNMTNMIADAPKETFESGKNWYANVHEATTKGAKETGMSTKAASGIVAAVSPNMDWEHNNINAFSELHSLSGHDWAAIHSSAAHSAAARAYNYGNGFTGDHPNKQSTERDPGVAARLKGMSISAAPDNNLIKAQRIMGGEDPESVMPRRTAPKTNSFMHNIYDPSRKDGPVTVDGRQHDIIADRMEPWVSNRGIGSAALSRGRSRYEDMEDATRGAAHIASKQFGKTILPHEAQAIAWTHAKNLELSVPTKSGADRKQGPERVGQPYSRMLGQTQRVGSQNLAN